MAGILPSAFTAVAAFMSAVTSDVHEPDTHLIGPAESAASDITARQSTTFQTALNDLPAEAQVSFLLDNNHNAIGTYRYLASTGVYDLAATGHTALMLEMPYYMQDNVTRLAKGEITLDEFIALYPNYTAANAEGGQEGHDFIRTFYSVIPAAGQAGLDVYAVDSTYGLHMRDLIDRAPTRVQNAFYRQGLVEDEFRSFLSDKLGEDWFRTADAGDVQRGRTAFWETQSQSIREQYIEDRDTVQRYRMQQRFDDRLTADFALQAIETHRENNPQAGKVALLYGSGHYALDMRRGLDEQIEQSLGRNSVAPLSLLINDDAIDFKEASLESLSRLGLGRRYEMAPPEFLIHEAEYNPNPSSNVYRPR